MMMARFVLLSLLSTVGTSLRVGMPPKSELVDAMNEDVMSSVLPAEILSMPGLDMEMFKSDLEDMELKPSSELLALTNPHPVANLHAEVEVKTRQRPMMWVHIHKAGGSFICAAAHLNQESVPKRGGNCNSKLLNDGGMGGLYPGHTTCQERETYFAKENLTWGQTERVLGNEMCFKTFDYGIWLRDPVSLAQSEVKFKKYSHGDVRRSITCLTKGGGCPRNEEKKDDMPLWKFFDNYAVRVLGGANVYNRKPGQVTEEDYNQVKQLLSRFKLKVAMEDVVKEAKYRNQFLQGVGWRKWPAADDSSNAQGTRIGEPTMKRFLFSEETKQALREVNQWDYKLYESVRAKH